MVRLNGHCRDAPFTAMVEGGFRYVDSINARLCIYGRVGKGIGGSQRVFMMPSIGKEVEMFEVLQGFDG